VRLFSKQRPCIDESTFVDTTRLLIRPPIPEDSAACGETVDDFVVEQQGWLPEYREQLVAGVVRGLYASRTERVLFDRSAGVVGMLSARPVGSWATREVGYWVGPRFRGQGYMAEGLEGFIPWLFEDGADVLIARTALDNVASRRILAGAGFIEMYESPHTLPNGVTVASMYYERCLRRM